MSGGSEPAGGGEVPPSDAVLFILVSFACGIFIRLCLKGTKVPYTAMLLLWGLAIGFLQLAHPQTHAFTNTLSLWLRMEPHLLLLIFLPIIGFSAAIGQEPHMLRKSWGQIMLLAWPGVVSQFLLIALAAKFFFPYNWSWPEAFLFGAMMSATDPVAVVAVLQEVGASQKLACVIDGEALMNDGSALVIFLVLQKIVQGEPVTIGGAVAQFCLLAVVGMLLGIAFGGATSWLLEHIFRDPTLTTVVTLVSAYASYYVADRLVGASGLLAVVMNGFTMSVAGGRQITLRAQEAMHGFWGLLEWGANTILFVWMGIMLAIVLPPSHEATSFTNHPIHLVPSDAGYVAVLFLWLQVSRGLLILLCWLPFNYTGYPLTWRSALVIVWGGLRGAVGMVMALFIFLDDKIHDASFRSYCIFYMGTMAFFTVLINGGTCKWLLRRLGFMSYTPEQLTTLHHVVEDMDSMRDRRLRDLGPDEVLGEPEPDAVRVWTSLPTGELLAEAAASTVQPPLDLKGRAAQAAMAAGLDLQLIYDYRCRMLHMVKAHYAEAYNQHLLGTSEARVLQAVADKALDEAGEGLHDWDLLHPQCTLHGLPWLMQTFKLHVLSPTLVQAAVYQQQLSNLQLLVGFIHAHRHAQDVLRQHIKVVGDAPVVSAAALARASSTASSCHTADASTPSSPRGDPATQLLERFRSFQVMAGPRGGAEALFVLQESEQEAAAALALTEQMTLSHPSLPAWLRSKQAAADILTAQHDFLSHLADAGLVQPRELLLLEDLMHHQCRLLLQSNTGLAAALNYSRSRPPINLLPLFDSLTDQQVAELLRAGGARDAAKPGNASSPSSSQLHHGRVTWRVFYPEQLMAAARRPVSCVIVVTKGAVRMRFPVADGPHGRSKEHTVVASVGDALGVCELMLGFDRMADLIADSMVQALLVPAPVFLDLVRSQPGVRERAWQATAAQLAAQHHHILGEHRQLAPLNFFFRSCMVERMAPGQEFDVQRTALLLTGVVKSLLPLPADFNTTVNNPNRSVSAADLLWPGNASDAAAGPGAGGRGGSIKPLAAGGGSSAGSLSSLGGSSQARPAAAAAGAPRPALGGGGSTGSLPPLALNGGGGSSGGGDGPHGGSDDDEGNHDDAARSVRGGSPTSSAAGGASRTSSAGALSPPGRSPSSQLLRQQLFDPGPEQPNVRLLAAPSELPPGRFECLQEAMVLQVPRGSRLPGHLETTTYQAQVLGKGSILRPQGSGNLGDPVKSPMKDRVEGALSRLSRLTRGLPGEGSDSVPRMQFLQRALQSMRAEQQHGHHSHSHSRSHGHGHGHVAPGHRQATAASGVPAASAGLHTVVEIHSSLGDKPGPSPASSPVAAMAVAPAAPGGGAGEQGASPFAPLASVPAPPSSKGSDASGPAGGSPRGSNPDASRGRGSGSEPAGGAAAAGASGSTAQQLRATAVVLRNASLRKRLLLGRQEDAAAAAASDHAAAAGSPRAELPGSPAAPSDEAFVASRSSRSLAATGRLSGSFQRRSGGSLS